MKKEEYEAFGKRCGNGEHTEKDEAIIDAAEDAWNIFHKGESSATWKLGWIARQGEIDALKIELLESYVALMEMRGSPDDVDEAKKELELAKNGKFK